MHTHLRLTSALLASVIAAGLIAAAAHSDPSARPIFARSYVGTVTGALRTGDRTDTWTVKGLTFKLLNARLARGRWGGTYLATAGRVTFMTKDTGEGRYATTGSLALRHLSWDSAAISFLQNMRETGYTYQGRATKSREITVARKCGDGDDAYTTHEIVSPAGGLWLETDISERFQPGRRVRGSYTDRSDRGVRTWTWNLKPRG